MTTDNSSNIICNFLMGEEGCNGEVGEKILIHRREGAFPYHCTLFNLHPHNKISFSSGLHFLNT